MAEPFGKYLLHEKIAQGGMAEVFVATREGDIGGFTRRLAIKRMFPHLVERDEVITMFIDEARIAARLNHPNIVQIYDLGVVDGTFFIAMEYVDGLDLRRMCEMGVNKKNFISRPLAVHIATQVAMGLDYAHSRTDEHGQPMNIVHRDVSPQNVLVSTDGAVKVCDFGIAKAENRLTDTQVGEFKGKFSYMSPEQFGHDNLDHRSDIFTLGIVLYETTVGTRLFRADSEYETMQKVTDGDFHPPRRIRPDYPRRLEEIVLKALKTDPADRYQSAGALQEDLEDWLFEQRIRTGPRQLSAYLEELLGSEQGGSDSTDDGRRVVESAKIERPEPPPSLVEERREEDDETVQMALTSEQMRQLGRENELDEAVGLLEEEEEDPTIQMEVSREELEELRQIAEQGVEQAPEPVVVEDQTVRDIEPPRAVAELRSSSVEAVDVRRQNEERRPGRGATFVEGQLDEETTSPMDTPAVRLEFEDEKEDDEDITGKWSGERKRGGGDRENSPQPVPASKGSGNGAPASSSSPAPKTNPMDQKTTARQEDDQALEDVPNLRPGGRELTGLNVVPRESEAVRSTTPVPTVRGDEDTIFGVNRSWVIIASVATATLTLGLVVVAIVGGDEEGEDAEERLVDREEMVDDEDQVPLAEEYEAVGDDEIRLTIETEPAEAAVVVNGVLQRGQTPLEAALVDGRDNEVWLIRNRYRPKRLLIPAEGEDLERSVELERTAGTEDVEVTFSSDPEGAKVWINGEKAPFGTPVTMNVGAGLPTHVQFVKDGYRPHVALVDFAEDGANLKVSLSDEEEQVVYGEYALRPGGSQVSVGGRQAGQTPFALRHHNDEWLELEVEAEGYQPRHHRFRLDQVGGFTLAMALDAEAQKTGTVSIDVEPQSAVYIDARAFGSSPVEEVELPAGEQTVVLETREGRLRVPLEVEVDAHLDYHIELDGDEAEVARVE